MPRNVNHRFLHVASLTPDGYTYPGEGRIMSHIHLPDGILPFWLWIAGYAMEAVLVAIVWWRRRVKIELSQFALLGVLSAIMILVMMIEIPPFSFHFNLSVATGIILGPKLAILAALIVNLILALIGHGGLTVIGWNSVVLSVEMIAGYYLFHLFTRVHLKLPIAAFIATFIGLALGTLCAYQVIVAASPWIDRQLATARLSGEAIPYVHTDIHLDLGRVAALMFGIGALGWIVEGLLTAAILNYLNKVYPTIISGNDDSLAL